MRSFEAAHIHMEKERNIVIFEYYATRYVVVDECFCDIEIQSVAVRLCAGGYEK